SAREKLVEDFPEEVEFRTALGRNLTNLGDLLRSEGKNDEAAAIFQRSIAILEPLVKQFPLVPIYRRYLAMACNNWGSLLSRTTQRTKAEDAYRRAADLMDLDKLRKLFPVGAAIPAEYLQELSSAFNNLGVVLRAEGKPEEAEKALRRGVEIKAKL